MLRSGREEERSGEKGRQRGEERRNGVSNEGMADRKG